MRAELAVSQFPDDGTPPGEPISAKTIERFIAVTNELRLYSDDTGLDTDDLVAALTTYLREWLGMFAGQREKTAGEIDSRLSQLADDCAFLFRSFFGG